MATSEPSYLGAREKQLAFPSVTLRGGEEVTLTRTLSSPYLARGLFIEDDVARSLVVLDLLADRETLLTDLGSVDPDTGTRKVLPAPGLSGLGPWPGNAFLHKHGSASAEDGGNVLFRHSLRRPAWQFVLRLRSVSGHSLLLTAGAFVLIGEEFLTRPKPVDEEHLVYVVKGSWGSAPDCKLVETYRLNEIYGAVTREEVEGALTYGARTWAYSQGDFPLKARDRILSPEFLRAGDARDALFVRMIDLARKAEL